MTAVIANVNNNSHRTISLKIIFFSFGCIDDMSLSTRAIITIVLSVGCGIVVICVIVLLVIIRLRRNGDSGANGYKLVNSDVEMANKK